MSAAGRAAGGGWRVPGVLVVITLCATPGWAQGPRRPGGRDTVALEAPFPRTHWVEGGIIGALLLGGGGAYVAHGFCSDPDSSGSDSCTMAGVGGALVGGLTGFGVGALIGGAFPKKA
jgi:hypothetical protein